MASWSNIFVACCLSLLFAHQSICARFFTLATPKSCGNDEFFDSSLLVCRKCGENQQRSSNGLSCQCSQGHHQITSWNGTKIECAPCALNQTVSAGGWNCVSCSDSFDNATGNCTVCIGGVTEERWENETLRQMCIPCKDPYWPDATGIRCVRCPSDFLSSSNGKCLCGEKFTLIGGTCIPTKRLLPPESSLFTITYQNEKKVKWHYFQEHLQASVYNCKVLGNNTACQVLANLCVLLLYRTNDSPLEPTACSQFLQTDTHLPHQRSPSIPWLFYVESNAALELARTDVPNRFSTDSRSSHSHLNLTLIKYSLDGKYQGMKSFSDVLTQVCKTVQVSAFSFGTNFHRKCKIGTAEFWRQTPQAFYDAYLSGIVGNEEVLYPVPILIRNLVKNGQKINTGSNPSDWLLVRRFFLLDPAASAPEDTTLRYVRSLVVRVNVLENNGEDSFGRISPPLLVLEYGETNTKDRITQLEVKVDISYAMEQGQTFQRISIALGVLSSLCIFWTCFATWGWAKRAGREAIEFLVVLKFVVFLCGNLANVFLLVLLLASLNWLVLFKSQDAVHLLLPSPEQETLLFSCLVAALVMKTLHILHLLVEQCTVNLFFMDWERPTTTNAHRRSSNVDDVSRQEVAIWRMYFVANRWDEIQMLRRVPPSSQLFLLVLFLKVLAFETLSLCNPSSRVMHNLEGHEFTPFSSTARFALSATTFVCLAFIQACVCRLLCERFFRDRLQQFVDLCSVCNISLFLMTGARYGHYVHGRSAHGRAEVSMKEMHDLLRKEEEDLCGQRGLLPNTEQQTFTMFLPSGIQEQYARLLLPLTSYSQAVGRMQGVGGRLSKVDVDRVQGTYQMLNKFLCGFIEHAFKDLDYVVRDRLLLEKLLDLEFSQVLDKGHFYHDNGHSFDAVLFCGQETTLLTFELLLFTLSYLTSGDVVLAAILTYFISKVLEWIRRSAGRRNLVRKALVDERFVH